MDHIINNLGDNPPLFPSEPHPDYFYHTQDKKKLPLIENNKINREKDNDEIKIKSTARTPLLFSPLESVINLTYNNFIEAEWGDLTKFWLELTVKNRVSLVKYLADVYCLEIDHPVRKSLNKTIHEVKKHKHFPPIVANLIFELAFTRNKIEEIKDRFKDMGWENLLIDEKIAMLYDLSERYPEMIEQPDSLYDTVINHPDYFEPVVVKEINYFALLNGNFNKVYEHFLEEGWEHLSIDEKIVLTDGLCRKHWGLTKNLNHVLYNLRVYKEMPSVIVAEKDNISINRYLQHNITCPIVIKINEYFEQSDHGLLPIKGVTPDKVMLVLKKLKRNKVSLS